MTTTFKRTGGSLRTRSRPGEVERAVRRTSAERMAVWALRLPPEPLKTADNTRLARDIAEPRRQHRASDALAHGLRLRRRRFGGVVARRFDGLLAHKAMVRQELARAAGGRQKTDPSRIDGRTMGGRQGKGVPRAGAGVTVSAVERRTRRQ